VIAAVGLSAAMIATGLAVSADPPDTNPTTAPIPAIPKETDAKSLVADVLFDSRLDATPVSAEVRYGAAHSHLGDPPLLRLEVLDENGALLDEFNAWHPLWAFVEDSVGSESRIILDQANGTFIVPFDRDAVTMTITDAPLAEPVVEIDLTGAITEFCTDNPEDPSCRVGDLAVTRVEATSVPSLLLVDGSGEVTVETDVTNLGPSTPMDATVSYSVTADAGVTINPTAGTSEHALDLNESETDARDYEVSCVEPGLHDITFTSSIAPSHAADIDLMSDNNLNSEVVTVDCVVPITININPGKSPNPINISVRSGSTPVALLTTAIGEYGNPLAFNAASIDPKTTRFGSSTTILADDGAVARAGRGHIVDGLEPDNVTKDGDLDMVIQFLAPVDTGLVPGDTEACVLGEFSTGTKTFRFWGCDQVKVIR
jgi:hypothetical protein